jgi:alkylation response protein AidB-like acyl-CoA dehydrogenase
MTHQTSEPRQIEELLEGIEANFDELDSTAVEAEHLGAAPPALDTTIRKLRVPMIKAPLEAGGDHLHLADQMRYFEALSHANPTAGWTGFNHAGAAGMAGATLDDEGLELLFGAGRVPVMAGVSAPSGTYRHVDGGVEASGTWRYASGVRTADWVMLTAIEETGGPSGVRLIIVNTDDAEVGGDWNVMALKGTGSVNVTLTDTFIPEALAIDPLRGPTRGGPMYTLGYQAFVSGENLGFTLGVCQRFLDEIAEYACGKARGSDGRLADRGAFQYELGKGQLAVNAARAYGLQLLGDADTQLRAGSGLDAIEQEAIVAMMAYCTEHATNTVSHLFHFAGAGALFDTNILQRCFRDAHGSAQHHVASNIVYDRFGRSLLAIHDPSVVG